MTTPTIPNDELTAEKKKPRPPKPKNVLAMDAGEGEGVWVEVTPKKITVTDGDRNTEVVTLAPHEPFVSSGDIQTVTAPPPLSSTESEDMELLTLIWEAREYARLHKPKQHGERARLFQIIATDLEKVFGFTKTWLVDGMEPEPPGIVYPTRSE